MVTDEALFSRKAGQANPESQVTGTSARSREAIIQVRGLTNRFGKQLVHDKLDLDVYRGEILGIIGGSGSGKSVLLRTIIGLMPVREGTVTLGKNGGNDADFNKQWGVLFGDERPQRSPLNFPVFRKKTRGVQKTLEQQNDIEQVDDKKTKKETKK